MIRYAACLLMALSLSGCTKVCNEMGCIPNSYTTLRLTEPLDARQANHVRVQASGQTLECDLPAGARDCTAPSEITAIRSGDQWTQLSLPAAIQESASITVTRNGAPTTRDVTPTTETDYPNGEDCPPACPHPVLTF